MAVIGAVLGLLVVGVIVAIVAVTLFDVLFRPTFRRLAVRNILRRKNEAMLVVLGSLLGTAIITSSFVVGDTLDASIRDLGRTQLGPIDVSVEVSDIGRLAEVADAVGADPIPGSDGVLAMAGAPVTAATPETDGERRAEPRAFLHEVDFEAARSFGSDEAATGFAAAGDTPGEGQAVVGDDLAADLGLGEGDTIEVFAYGRNVELEIVGTVPRLGVAGYYPADGGSESPVLFAAPGTLEGLVSSFDVADGGASAPQGWVFVSNEGGVFDGVTGTPAVFDELERRVGDLDGVSVQAIKQELLDDAEETGNSFGELFTGIGGFSVIAGVLLLVNIFVMLSEERKTELGMLRAVGLKRNHLVRTFGMEGGFYALVAAVAGALVGVGVGRIIVIATAGIFNQNDDFTFDLRFAAEPASIVTGLLIGLVIALLTVWGTSLRIGRLNVIRAIRDLPEPPRTGRSLASLIFGALGVLVGLLLFSSGVSSKSEIPALMGPAIALFSTVPLLTRLAPRRLAVSLPCALALFWGIFSFSLLPDVFANSDIPAFVVQGVILVGAAVAIGTANADLVSHLADRLSGSSRSLALRLALANPLAKKFRTALLLSMFSIVIFTLTFLATFANIFQEQAPRLADETSAGYDLLLDSNPANPPTDELLEGQPEVEAVAPLLRGLPDFEAEFVDGPEEWPLSGFDERLLALEAPALSSRESQYASDLEAWEAVLVSPDLAVVPDFFLQDDGGPAEGSLDAGDEFTIIDPQTGEERTLTAVGIIEGDWVFNGVMVGADFAGSFLDDVVANRHYVQVVAGADPDEVASALTGRLLANGVDAESFSSIIEGGLSQQAGFFRLMEGFLGLGLVIGIAGLGVVMVRAVRERRRQIGMLRAMGFSSALVRSAFLLEAGFIAVQGIVIGVVLGLVVGWSLLSSSETFGDQPLPFSVPWFALVIVLVVPLLASLLAALAPAAAASRIRPAAALRIAD